MKKLIEAAIRQCDSIEWSIGGCDRISVVRHDHTDAPTTFAVFDSRGVRQGARMVSEHATFDEAVHAAIDRVNEVLDPPDNGDDDNGHDGPAPHAWGDR
jgi:hypothetical protein